MNVFTLFGSYPVMLCVVTPVTSVVNIECHMLSQHFGGMHSIHSIICNLIVIHIYYIY